MNQALINFAIMFSPIIFMGVAIVVGEVIQGVKK
jgi:hypothetical protein